MSNVESVINSLRIVYITRGILASGFALLALLLPEIALSALIFIFAGYAIFAGIITIIASYATTAEHDFWWLYLIEGTVGLIIGMVTIFSPQFTTIILLYVFSAWNIIVGSLKIINAIFFSTKFSGTLWLGLVGGVYLTLGSFILGSDLEDGIMAVIRMISLLSFMSALGFFMTAFRLKKFIKIIDLEIKKTDIKKKSQ